MWQLDTTKRVQCERGEVVSHVMRDGVSTFTRTPTVVDHAVLACGHVVPVSEAVRGGQMVWCVECERTPAAKAIAKRRRRAAARYDRWWREMEAWEDADYAARNYVGHR